MDYIIIAGVLGVCLYTISKLRHRFNKGCCDQEEDQDSSTKIKEESYPYHKRLVVSGMHCEQCQQRVKRQLDEIDDYYCEPLDFDQVDLYALKPIHQEQVQLLVANAGYQLKEMRDCE